MIRTRLSTLGIVLVGSSLYACGASDSSRKVLPGDGGVDGSSSGGSSSGGSSSGGSSSGGSSSGGSSSGGSSAGGAESGGSSSGGAGQGGSSGMSNLDGGDAGGASSSGGAGGGAGGSSGAGAGGGTGTGGTSSTGSDGGADASADSSTPICAVDGTDCSSAADARAVCCGGQCVPGDCCQAADCGSATDAGGAGYLCQANHCVNVAGTLSGLLWQLPCTAGSDAVSCYTNANTTVSTTLGGVPGVTYDVSLHFRGVVEQKTYTNGCTDGAYWSTSGTPGGDTYNLYKLTVSSPPQTFYLNAGTSYITHVFALDYGATLRVNAGATVTLFADAIDGAEIKNLDASNTPISVPGTQLAQPYDGQFIQMDVVSVTPDPSAVAGGGTAGSALAFNGSQLATVADSASLRAADVTTEAWFQFASPSGSYNSILGKAYGSGTADSYTIWYQSGVLNSGANISSPSGANSLAWSTFNEWHHAAMTFDSGKQMQTLFIDGLPVSCISTAGPIAYDDHALLLGGDVDNGSINGYWNGTLDEVRVFSTTRTPGQVWADMHTHRLGTTTGLVGEWTFDEGSGQIAADSSGNANDALLGATSAVEASDPTWVTSTAP